MMLLRKPAGTAPISHTLLSVRDDGRDIFASSLTGGIDISGFGHAGCHSIDPEVRAMATSMPTTVSR